MIQIIQKKIQHIRAKGKVAPSGKYLIDHMVSKISFEQDQDILQLGFGTGVFTKQILKRLSPKSTLAVFEIDPVCKIHMIEDERMSYYEDSAAHIGKYFPEKKFDVIISTLPFGSLPKEVTKSILDEIPKFLKNGGKFLQFQYVPLHKKQIEQAFGKPSKLSFVGRNIPPAFIYEIEK